MDTSSTTRGAKSTRLCTSSRRIRHVLFIGLALTTAGVVGQQSNISWSEIQNFSQCEPSSFAWFGYSVPPYLLGLIPLNQTDTANTTYPSLFFPNITDSSLTVILPYPTGLHVGIYLWDSNPLNSLQNKTASVTAFRYNGSMIIAPGSNASCLIGAQFVDADADSPTSSVKDPSLPFSQQCSPFTITKPNGIEDTNYTLLFEPDDSGFQPLQPFILFANLTYPTCTIRLPYPAGTDYQVRVWSGDQFSPAADLSVAPSADSTCLLSTSGTNSENITTISSTLDTTTASTSLNTSISSPTGLQPSNQNSKKVAAIAGGIVAGFAIVFIAILTLSLLLRRRARRVSEGERSAESSITFAPRRSRSMRHSGVVVPPVARMRLDSSGSRTPRERVVSNLRVVNVSPEPLISRRPVLYDEADRGVVSPQPQQWRGSINRSPFDDMMDAPAPATHGFALMGRRVMPDLVSIPP